MIVEFTSKWYKCIKLFLVAKWLVHLTAMWEVSISSPSPVTYLCWNMHVGKQLAALLAIKRCCTKGESQGTCNTYTSAKLESGCPLCFETKRRETSPEVQNRGISGHTRKWLMSSKNLHKTIMHSSRMCTAHSVTVCRSHSICLGGACMSPLTTHVPLPHMPPGHAHPPAMHAPGHTCPPAMHTPPHTTPSHRRLWKYNLAPTSLRAVKKREVNYINVCYLLQANRVSTKLTNLTFLPMV